MSTHYFVKNPREWQQYANSLHFCEEPATAQIVDHGIALPLILKSPEELGGMTLDIYKGGICDRNGSFVAGRNRISDTECGNLGCQGAYAVAKSTITTRNERVLFGGLLYKHFGHTFVDGFARLWYAIEHDDFDRIIFLDFPFEFPQDFDPFNLIELTGIDMSKCEVVRSPTQFREIIVPEEVFRSFGLFKKEFLLPFTAIKERVSPGTDKKLYLSRRAYQELESKGPVIPNHMYNEEWFEDFFVRRDYVIKHPEQMSIKDQVSMIAGADEIVATVGTLTHLELFASPGTRVIVLNRAGLIEAQMRIDKICGIQPYYIDATRNPLPTYHVSGPFLMAPNHYFRECMDELGISYTDEEMEISDDLPRLLDLYLREWANVYRTQQRAWMLAENTMFDAVKQLNEFYYDDSFDEEAYREADRYRPIAQERDLLERDLNSLRRELDETYASKSWRITAPLRALRRLLSKH